MGSLKLRFSGNFSQLHLVRSVSFAAPADAVSATSSPGEEAVQSDDDDDDDVGGGDDDDDETAEERRIGPRNDHLTQDVLCLHRPV